MLIYLLTDSLIITMISKLKIKLTQQQLNQAPKTSYYCVSKHIKTKAYFLI